MWRYEIMGFHDLSTLHFHISTSSYFHITLPTTTRAATSSAAAAKSAESSPPPPLPPDQPPPLLPLPPNRLAIIQAADHSTESAPGPHISPTPSSSTIAINKKIIMKIILLHLFLFSFFFHILPALYTLLPRL